MMHKSQLISGALTVLLGIAPALLAQSGNVGIGTTTPTATLHVEPASNDGNVLVRAATGGPSSLFVIENNAGTFFRITNATGQGGLGSWTFSSTGANNFVISSQGNPGSEFSMTPAGDLTIAGNLTQASSREVKRDVVPVDAQEVLGRLAELPITTWAYQHDRANVRHIGPMAEDFYEVFGLNGTRKGISSLDASGVALAAIQALQARLEGLEELVAQLTQESVQGQ